MTVLSKARALVLQSGGVTPVINQSLSGVVQEALSSGRFGAVYGAVHGMEGLLAGDFVELGQRPDRLWRAIARTPGAALGSARKALKGEEVDTALGVLKSQGIEFLFPIGGNDSADGALRLVEAAGESLHVVAVPKTVDNDLPAMDHCPGYGSAARFIALATMGMGRDAESMGMASPVTVLEVMGRNAGWLAAASALGKRDERDAPHFVCFPERLFDEATFTDGIENALTRWGFAVAVVNENIRGPKGPVGHTGDPFRVDDFGHPYFDSPAQYLAGHLARRLRVRVRAERPGTIQRSLVQCTSYVDAAEAFLVGRAAVRYALAGHTGVIVTLLREPGHRYHCYTGTAPLEAIAGKERTMPSGLIDEARSLPTPAFSEYARPLLGAPLPRFRRLL